MKKFGLIIVFICFFVLLSAQKSGLPNGKTNWGLFFSMNGLTTPFAPENDGYQTGACAKYWFDKNTALKGLVSFDGVYSDTITQTIMGLGGGAEFHPAPGIVSPYIGALGGVRILMEAENSIDFYAGADAGVEVMIYKNFCIAAEYEVLLFMDATGFNIEAGKSALVSLGIYF